MALTTKPSRIKLSNFLFFNIEQLVSKSIGNSFGAIALDVYPVYHTFNLSQINITVNL
jgi:hypothetical protein